MSTSPDAFQGKAQGYSAVRPQYPDSLLARVTQALKQTPPDTGAVLDVGSGTGIFTRQLRACLPADIAVIGIEPSADMRAEAMTSTAEAADVSYIEGSAERLPVQSASARGLVAAASAHWFERPAFYAEAARVLRPSGLLAIVEYVRDPASPAAAALTRFTAEHGGPASHERPDYEAELAGLTDFELSDVVLEPQVIAMTVGHYVGLALSSSHARPAIETLGRDRAVTMLTDIARSLLRDERVPFGYVFQFFGARRKG